LEEDFLLSLEKDIFGPSDESGQISSGLNITTDSEASGFLLEKRVSLNLRSLSGLGSLLGKSLWWLKENQ